MKKFKSPIWKTYGPVSGTTYDPGVSSGIASIPNVLCYFDASKGTVYTDGAVKFNATYGDRLTNASLKPSGSFGISCWFKPQSSTFAAIASQHTSQSSNQGNFMLYQIGTAFTTSQGPLTAESTVLFRVMNNGDPLGTGRVDAYIPTGGTGYSVGSWNHVAAWYDSVAQTVSIVLNGGTVYSYPVSFVPSFSSTVAFAIGARSNVANWGSVTDAFNGSADSTAWYSSMSSTLAASLYNSGVGKTYAQLSASDKVGLVSWWDLDEPTGTRYDSHGTYHLTGESYLNIIGAATQNGGFETAGSPIANLTNNVAGSSTVTRDTTTFYAGTASALFTTDSSGSFTAAQTDFVTTSGVTYYVSLYIKRSAGSGTFNVADVALSQSGPTWTPTASWAQYTGTVTGMGGKFQLRTNGSNASTSINVDNLVVSTNGPTPDVGIVAGQASDQDPVSSWYCGISNTYATQTAAGNRAKYVASAINGRPAILFNGLTSFMNAAAITTLGDNVSVFAVLVPDTGYSGRTNAIVAGNTGAFQYDFDSNLRNRLVSTGTATMHTATNAMVVSTPYLVSATYSRNGGTGGTAAQYLNGAANGTASSISASAFSAASSFIGKSGTASQGLSAYLGALVVVNRNVTQAERWKIEGYIAQRFGITVTQA